MKIKEGMKVKLVDWDKNFSFENGGYISEKMKKYFGKVVTIKKYDYDYEDGLHFGFDDYGENVSQFDDSDSYWWIGYEHIKEIVEG